MAPVGELADDELVAALGWARTAMLASVAGSRGGRRVYRRAGRPCPRCGTPIESRGQGDANRTAYWCPRCQPSRDVEAVSGAVVWVRCEMTASSLALPSRYHGSELIATGGMADVYAATDSMLGRRVAIKVLGERFALDPDLRARFTREARIAARLSNEPNVVTIFDVADADGRPAIVMEYLPGGTVADRMRARPRLARAGARLARRRRPGARRGARAGRRPPRREAGEPDACRRRRAARHRLRDRADRGRRLPHERGTILGTSGYMSPEQAVGGTATPASDRYALAVVAFELLTGRRPYVAESFASEAAAHATAPIPAATASTARCPRRSTPSSSAGWPRPRRTASGRAASSWRA